MSEKFLYSLIEDLYSDLKFLRNFFGKISSKDVKTAELKKRLRIKLDETEYDLALQKELCKYLSIIRNMKPEYKELYTRILFKLSQHRKSIYLFQMIYELIFFREKIYDDKDLQRSLKLIDKYIDSLVSIISQEKNLLLISTPQNEYASLPILGEKIFILMFPLTDLTKPWKWVLLSHELGHLFFQYHKDRILNKTLPIIRRELNEIIRDIERIKVYLWQWEEYWLEELVSDIIAVGFCGPAYLKMLTIQASEERPTFTYYSHPPLDARAIAQITYMKIIDQSKEIVQIMDRVWREYRAGVHEKSSLPEHLSEELVEHVSQIIAEEIIQTPFIIGKWNDFKDILNSLPNIEEIDTIDVELLIPALALSGTRIKL